MASLPEKIVALATELRRRRVVHVGVAYLVGAWAVIEVTATVFPLLFISENVVRIVTVAAVLGFPVALVLAWAFDITPQGVRRAPAPESLHHRHPRAPLVLVSLTVAATALAGAAAWLLWLGPRQAPGFALAGLDPARVAVLYFDDHSEGRQLGYVADGFTEALIHELAQIEPLEVVSRNGVKPYRDPDVSLDSIALALRAGSLVEGSLEGNPDRLVTTVQLIDARTGVHTLSRRIERSGADVLALRDDIVLEATRLLSRTLGRELDVDSARGRTESPEAWSLVERARALQEDADTLRWKLGDEAAAHRVLDRADSLLALAESYDPDWARPTLTRAEVAGQKARSGLQLATAEEAALARTAIGHVDRVLARWPDHAGALALRGTLGYQLGWHTGEQDTEVILAAAESDLRKAVALDPGNAPGWISLADILRSRGDFAEAAVAAERALEADPFLIHAEQSILFTLAHVWLELEDFDRAIRWNAEGRRRYPADPSFQAERLIIMASAPEATVDVDSAWALVRAVERGYGMEQWSHGALQVAAVLARVDRVDSARSVIRRVRDRGGTDPWLDYFEANVRVQLGEAGSALELLERFLEAMPHRRSYIARDWLWRPLRGSPRFQRMVES